MLRNTQGLQAPLKLQMERSVASKVNKNYFFKPAFLLYFTENNWSVFSSLHSMIPYVSFSIIARPHWKEVKLIFLFILLKSHYF